jgi:hypothetical protein
MSLELRIRTKNPQAGTELGLVLDDDGYYWFLHPLFERLRDESGKYLDLYGDVLFTRDDFPRLRRVLDQAEVLAAQQPPTWKVNVGTQLEPTRKERFQLVHRAKLTQLIANFRQLVDTADQLGGYLEATGD